MNHMSFTAVLLLLLCLCCATAVVRSAAVEEYNCKHDLIANMAGATPTVIVRELPRWGRSGVRFLTASEPEWKPIRFGVFTEDLKNESRYCTAVGQERPNFRGGLEVCSEGDIMTEERKSLFEKEIVPQGVKLHAERLLVQRMTKPIVVAKDAGICRQFTIPSTHHTEGVKDADMVLYITAGLSYGYGGWSSECVTLENGRPIVGVVNFNVAGIRSGDGPMRVIGHEVAHALGFGGGTLKRLKMVTYKNDLRGKPSIPLLATSKVMEKARAHYNCPTAPGMELEEHENGGLGDHWKARNVRGELMSGSGQYSALTMALFEDMGFYRANWSMAEELNWGRNAGCDFLEKKCVINGETAYPDMFCTKDDKIELCTFDRLGLGFCNLKAHDSDIPAHFQYFDNPRYGGGEGIYMDYCPFVDTYYWHKCADGDPSSMPGSRIGQTSKCFRGENLHYQEKRIGGVCVEVGCNKNGTVSMRYIGNDAWHPCPEGESITPSGDFTGGKIVCPKYYEVCPEIGRDKSEAKSNPTKSKVNATDAHDTLKQTKKIGLFLPLLTKVPDKVGDTNPVKGVRAFNSPFLVATGGVMVAFAEADYAGENNNINIDIVTRYIETQGNGWAETAAENGGGEWNTQLAMQLKGVDYISQLSKPLAVGKGNKIYLIAVNHAREKIPSSEWYSTGWNFLLSLGDLEAKSDVQGGKTINWQPPQWLDFTLVREFKNKTQNLPPCDGSAFLTRDGNVVFVVKGTDGDKHTSAIIHLKDTEKRTKYEWSFFESAQGCYSPSFFGWKEKLIMVPNCTSGCHNVKESTDMGKTWTDVVGPFAQVWDSLKGKQDFTVATIDNVILLLYTEPGVKKTCAGEKEETHLWFTDGYSQHNLGPIVADNKDDIFSGLLYTNGELFSLQQEWNIKGSRNVLLKRLKDTVDQIKYVLSIWKRVE